MLMSYFLHIYYCHIGRQTKYFSLCILYLSKRIFPRELILLLPTVFFHPLALLSSFSLLLAGMWSLYLSLYYFHHFHFFSLLHLSPLFTCYFITIDLFNGVGVFHFFFLHFIFCYFISFLFFFSHFVNGFVIVYILCFDLWNGLLFQTDFHFYHLRKILLDFSSHFWAGTNIFEQRYNYNVKSKFHLLEKCSAWGCIDAKFEISFPFISNCNPQ